MAENLPELATVRAIGTALAPLWLAMMLAPEVQAEYDRIGLPAECRYFAPRAAPLGPVAAPVVVSTFFNFSPAAVELAIPRAWAAAAPPDILAAQSEGVRKAFARAFADVDPAQLRHVDEQLTGAAMAACEAVEGRPLFSAYAALPWPDDPYLLLFHAAYLLREHRGDGHIAALLSGGLRGIDALVLHIAMTPAMGPVLRASRRWTAAEWHASRLRLHEDDWIERPGHGPDVLTERGRDRREGLEHQTDHLAAGPYAAIGTAGCRSLLAMAPVLGGALQQAGLTWSPSPQAR